MGKLDDFRLKEFLLTIFETVAANLSDEQRVLDPPIIASLIVMTIASPEFWTEARKKRFAEELTPYVRGYLEGTLDR